MKFSFLTCFFLLVSINICIGQKPDTLIKKLDSLTHKKDSLGAKQENNTDKTAYNEQTKITFKSYFILLGSNLKQEFTKPLHMTGRDWGKFGIFTLATAALSFADEPVQKQGKQDADQRADQEERDRDLASKAHPLARVPQGANTPGPFSP
jgi:hypothetical protein